MEENWIQRMVSVLNREPMGMKPWRICLKSVRLKGFSAQPRADGDEAQHADQEASQEQQVSVLNREPMGMKRTAATSSRKWCESFSAQPRADGDEARTQEIRQMLGNVFQCSTASRWG